MLMSQMDKMQIKNRGMFLVQKGYKVSTGQYGVTFDNGQMKIDVFYERYENHQDILLKFPSRKGYYLHFFALRIEKIDVRNTTPLQKLLAYMDYLERNYDNLMNEEYCEQCMEIVRQEMETLIEVPIYNNTNTGEKEMGNKNIIETPEDKKKGNFWSWISLGCFAGRFVVDIVIALVSGMATSIFSSISSVSDIEQIGEATTVVSEMIFAIGSCASLAMGIAALVIMIYVRVKYPKNTFGKVLMWVYIVLFALYIIAMVAFIIACGIACAACTNECQKLGMIVVERLMLC